VLVKTTRKKFLSWMTVRL